MADIQTLLLIEDQADIAQMYQIALDGHGYQTEIAATGTAGLAMIAELRPRMVILDIGLPDMSGLDLLEIVHSAAADGAGQLPVVLLTNYPETEYRERARALGAIDYVLKASIRPSRLPELVDAWVAAAPTWPGDFSWPQLAGR